MLNLAMNTQMFRPSPRFSKEDDADLRKLVKKYGKDKWGIISKKMQQFTPRMCRERYLQVMGLFNKKQKWTEEDDKRIVELINEFGTRWTILAKFFPNRSPNDLKNRFYRYILPKNNEPLSVGSSDSESNQTSQEQTSPEDIEGKNQKKEGNIFDSLDEIFSCFKDTEGDLTQFDTFEFDPLF